MRILKSILVVSTLIICNKCLAQGTSNKDYRQFVRRFTSVIYYPGELMGKLKPTVCLMKIKTDAEKNVLDMQLSDSADSLLKVCFDKHKSELDSKLLVNYFKAEYGNNNCTTYIIPLSYAMWQKQVPVQDVSIKSLYGYSKFNGNFLAGDVIFLDPIYTESSIPQR